MKTYGNKVVVLFVMLLGFVTPAWAHTGIGITHGFMAGFVHPFQGLDHLLVMFAIGLWASVQSGKMLWQLPVIFLVLMATGAGLHFVGFPMHYAELWVSLSVLAVGLIIWCNWSFSGYWAMGLVAVFALSHGYVHAAETEIGIGHLNYVSGFLVATTILISLGIAVSLLDVMRAYVFRLSFGLVSSTVAVLSLAN